MFYQIFNIYKKKEDPHRRYTPKISGWKSRGYLNV